MAERNRRSLNAETVCLLEQALETLPEEAELREQLRTLGRQARQRPSTPIVRESATREIALDADALLCVLRDQRDRLRALGVRRIGLFGSVLRGESRPAQRGWIA